MDERLSSINVVTGDNVVFNVEIDHLCHSIQLRRMLESKYFLYQSFELSFIIIGHPNVDDEFRVVKGAAPLRLRKTKSDVFRLILDWIERHKKETPLEEPDLAILPDELEIDISSIEKSTNSNNAVTKKPTFNDSFSAINECRKALEELRSCKLYDTIDTTWQSNGSIKVLLDYAEKKGIEIDKNKLFGKKILKPDVAELNTAKKEFDELKDDFNNLSIRNPVFNKPLIPHWDYQFFDGLQKSLLFDLVIVSFLILICLEFRLLVFRLLRILQYIN